MLWHAAPAVLCTQDYVAPGLALLDCCSLSLSLCALPCSKFLVDRSGNVVKRYGSTTTPMAIEADIKALL